jgi:hypothetical protein
MGVALGLALAAALAAHVALVAGLARRGEWGRAAIALVVGPLAPWWGWRAGMRGRTMAWLVAVALYAAGTFAT